MKRRIPVSICLASLCALLCSAPADGWAQDPSPHDANSPPSASADSYAKTAFAKGKALFSRGRYLEALAQFSAGYELSRRPLFLFNMGECARKLGEAARARAYYERYLAQDPGGPFAALAEKRLVELGGERPKPAAPPPAAAKPPPAAARPPPPPHRAVSSGAPAPAASPAGATHLNAAVGPEPEPERPLWKKWPFWAGIGAAAVTATAIVFVTSGDDGGCTGTCVDFRE